MVTEHSWLPLQEGTRQTQPEGKHTWLRAHPAGGRTGHTQGGLGRYTHIYTPMCVPAHTQVCLEGSGLPWGSGPGRTYERYKGSQPRGAASQRACRADRQSGGDRRACPAGVLLPGVLQKEVGRRDGAQGSPPSVHAQQGRLRSTEIGQALHCRVLTSHIQVSGGRVACACRVGRHTLVLALVRLLAALNLQGTCGDRKTKLRPGTPGGVSTFVACVDKMSQTLGPHPRVSAASGKLSLIAQWPPGWNQGLCSGAQARPAPKHSWACWLCQGLYPQSPTPLSVCHAPVSWSLFASEHPH